MLSSRSLCLMPRGSWSVPASSRWCACHIAPQARRNPTRLTMRCSERRGTPLLSFQPASSPSLSLEPLGPQNYRSNRSRTIIMKMNFRGWKREVTQHTHTVTSVKYISSKYTPDPGQPLSWSGPFQALGKLNNISLSGSFLVEFTFEEQELRSWLAEYVKAHPASAVRMLAQAQAEALIALNATPRVPPPEV